jgi:predicted aspartyl protease
MPLLGKKAMEPEPPDHPLIISSVGQYQRDKKIILRVVIQGNNKEEHHMTAIVDCGATENFIDKDYAEKIRIPLDRKKILRRVLAVDGREVASRPITHDTTINLTINNHREIIKLHCITIGNSPIIIGLPWLKKHNPNINWKEGRVTFDSEKCARKCLEKSPHAKTIPEDTAIHQYYEGLTKQQYNEKEETSQEDNDIWKELAVTYEDLTSPNKYDNDPEEKSGGKKDTEKVIPGIEQNPKNIVPKEYHDYLSVCQGKQTLTQPPHHHHDYWIPLIDNQIPPFKLLRALDETQLQTLKEYIDSSIKKGWIHSSTSPAGAPIHFIKKKDGGLCLCIDYQGLNAITIKDRTPLPLIGEALDRLSKAKVYTKLDVQDAYHNLCIAKGDEWKTAFQTKYSLYEYLVMPFGLTNAPASFQHWMNEVLSDYLDIFCIAYLDDILIYSDNITQYREHIRLILERIRQVGLSLKPTKCEFHTHKTEYLGYIIAPEGISMDPEKVNAVKEWQQPTTVKGIQSFLGFANFYRRFIRDFSKITTPLTKLIWKDTPFVWDDAAQQAFEKIKTAMISRPILHYFDPTRLLTLETDASDYAIGAVCSQPDSDGILVNRG